LEAPDEKKHDQVFSRFASEASALLDAPEKGLEFRREVFAFKRFKRHAAALRLIVVPNLTHYGHVESYNERLANLMVTGFKEYFRG